MHTFNETGPGVPAFLAKLWRLVEDPTTDNLISWSPDGKSFFIHNQAQFARELLPLNYKHNNMASFIRQLNMYGFHKITSIDNGGLKFDRDDMEFSHACFMRGHSYLLENIKRKIAHPKQQVEDNKGLIKTETVSKVLNEVKIMRGRQDTLDSRFSAMKQENEALWREIAVLRQKHMKQQQIVNKLIQFLVTIVQPQRTGLSGMGEKRRYQLMINDTPQASKMRRPNNSEDGPIIHDISEDLLDDVAQEEADLMNEVDPIVQSPNTIHSQTLDINEDECTLEDAINNDCDYYFTSSPDGSQIYRPGAPSNDSVEQNVANMNEISDEFNVFDETENILDTPMVKQEIKRTVQGNNNFTAKQSQSSGPPRLAFKLGKSILKRQTAKRLNNNRSEMKSSFLSNVNESTQTQTQEEMEQPVQSPEIMNNLSGESIAEKSMFMKADKTNQLPYIKSEKNMYTNQEDFLSAEMPNDLFDDDSINHHSEDPMIGGITLQGESYSGANTSSNVQNQNITGESSQATCSTKNDWAVQKTQKNENILKFNTATAFDQHLENFQGELESLKDLLHEGGVIVDPSTILGKESKNQELLVSEISNKMVSLANANESDQYLKLFTDADSLQNYGISMSEKKNEDQFNNFGSEVMTYQPSINCDLSELLDDNSGSVGEGNSLDCNEMQNQASSIMLNTPQYVSDFQPFKTTNAKNSN